MCVQVFPVPARDTSYSSKEEPSHRLLLLQVAEGTKEVLRGRQPICKYPVSFPAYYAMRALNFCFSVEMERSSALTQSLGTEPSPSVPDPQLPGKDTYLLLWTQLTFQIVPFCFAPLFLSPGSPDTVLL